MQNSKNEEFLNNLNEKVMQFGTYSFLVKIFDKETGSKETEVIMSVSNSDDINMIRKMNETLGNKKRISFG